MNAYSYELWYSGHRFSTGSAAYDATGSSPQPQRKGGMFISEMHRPLYMMYHVLYISGVPGGSPSKTL